MNDMASAITPKSDQLNSDDLIAGPLTITITEVKIRGGQEQPVSIHYEGDNGKPYKSCKSMNRVLVTAWGADAKKYVGRSMTLYRDPTVKWAGMEVGGIRISHMSDIPETLTMALTATKGSRRPFTVRPLKSSPPQPTLSADPPAAEAGGVDSIHRSALNAAATMRELAKAWNAIPPDERPPYAALRNVRQQAIAALNAPPDEFVRDIEAAENKKPD